LRSGHCRRRRERHRRDRRRRVGFRRIPAQQKEIALNRAIRIIAGHFDRREAATLIALSLASAVTEGVGLILLVPILAVLSSDTVLPGTLGKLASLLGGQQSLGLLLLAFVALVFLRALLNQLFKWAKSHDQRTYLLYLVIVNI
jgi:hypothetical protein